MKVTKAKTQTKAAVVAPRKTKKTTPVAVIKKAAMPQKAKVGRDIADIKSKAKAMGIIPGKLNKTDLILAIQKAEHNTPCFGTGTPACPYLDCCWRNDCIN